MSFKEHKKKLIERMQLHYQLVEKYPPLTAKILAYIVLDGRYGDITFSDFIELTGASKSSVSDSLHALLKINRIKFYNKPNDRKKYYTPNGLLNKMEYHLKAVRSDIEVIKEISGFDYAYRPDFFNGAKEKVVNTYLGYSKKIEAIMVEAHNELEILEAQININKSEKTNS